MPGPLALADQHYRSGLALRKRTQRALRSLWARMDARSFDASWVALAPLLFETMIDAQLQAAHAADDYADSTLRAQDINPEAAGEIDPRAFAGAASDGRPLASLLYLPAETAKVALFRGAGPGAAKALGLTQMLMIGGTQVADAGRAADGVAIAARPRVGGYVRMLSLPSCPRCAILAGKWYRWNAGFKRHPNCDCRHIPASEDNAGDLRTDPRAAIESGQVKGLSEGELQAIKDGADPGQVINARRGMRTVEIGGRQVRITSEGTTKRGWSTHVRRRIDELEGRRTEYTETIGGRRGYIKHYSTRRTRLPRLTPGEIYRVAKTREEAVRLLARNGYLLDIPGQTNSLISELARFASN